MAVVWQISVIHFEKKTLLCGVLLKKSPFVYHKRLSGTRNLFKVGRTYNTPVYKNKPVTITVGKEHYQVQTDRNGSFFLELDYITEDKIVISPEREGVPFKIVQSYPVYFKNTSGPYDIISDIDDTILVSYSASFLKRIRTLMLVSPHKRKSISFTQALFVETEKIKARVFYVSKSESNLFALLTAFIEYNRLPEGPLFLTPYLNFRGLLRGKKGKDHKLNLISFLLKHSGEKHFVLLGDDSQKDMEVYSEVVREHPGRIKQVLIRRTKPFMTSRQKKSWEQLKQVFPEAVSFDDGDKFDKKLLTF
jgi:phosphatidate phosphatase APP1